MLAYWDHKHICRFADNAYIDWFGKMKEDMFDKITMKELLGPLYVFYWIIIKRNTSKAIHNTQTNPVNK